MNKAQRKQLAEAISLLEQAQQIINDAKSIVETIKDEEQEKFDNLNEGMQAMEANQKLEENASALDDVYSDLDTMEDEISSHIDAINEVIEA